MAFLKSQQRQASKRMSASQLNQAEVARVAYELYEQRGRTNGYDLEDWFRAETIVRQRMNGS